MDQRRHGDGTEGATAEGAPLPPLWVRAAVSPDFFAQEQAALGRMWSFVGLVSDLPTDGDWFCTTLGDRSIFVQRFGAELRAFENRCAHRFYPLRTEARGNGPVVCGFHHWRYNKDGRALGIPMCPKLYDGAIPRDMDAKIPQLDLDCCGELIFVRFPAGPGAESLRDYLAEGYDVLATLAAPARPPVRFTLKIEAHWKFSHHISLDDYHLVAVHPTTFGKDGHLKPNVVKYHRFGRHSVFLATEQEGRWQHMLETCVGDGAGYQPEQYTILNMFPNTLVSLSNTVKLFGVDNWVVTIIRYKPVSHDRSEAEVWLFKAPFPQPETRLSRLMRPVVDRVLPPIVARVVRKIMGEDNAVCENQQRLAPQVEGEQRLSAYEQRIGWFEEAYRDALTPSAPARPVAAPPAERARQAAARP